MSLAVLPSLTDGSDCTDCTDQDTFELCTDTHDDTTCSGPHCEADYTNKPDQYATVDYSYTVECTMAGMAADYGTVEFCSVDCAREFAALDALQPDYQEMAGRDEGVTHDLTIFPADPWHAAVINDQGWIIYHCFAPDKAAAMMQCQEWLRTTSRVGHDATTSIAARRLETSTADDLLTEGTEDTHLIN